MATQIEVTDTFGGEANYCWVKRETFPKADREFTPLAARRHLIAKVRALAGWPVSVRVDVEDYGDAMTIRPRGLCQIAFAHWVEDEPKRFTADEMRAKLPVDALLAAFRRHIREELSPQQLVEVDRRNDKEDDLNICHSHDFCDANISMAEAVAELLGVPDIDDLFPDETDSTFDADAQQAMFDAMNAAWDKAKARGFSTDDY